IALLSVAIQGTLIPKVARKLDLVDDTKTVLKTFTDYQEDRSTTLIEYNVDSKSSWKEKTIMEADIPEEILIVMIKRDSEIIVPKGSTLINQGDILVLSGNNIEYLLEKNVGS
ncbi:MAG TPA: potassium/proton antiporter, partial [Clostridium sp.]|nr:potassium/proton antiporter [Clostridium sp.]